MDSKKVTVPKVSIAPMIDRTDKHFRYFCRLMTKQALLYSEMITANAIIHGNRNKLLDFHPLEKPVALQIAGSNVDEIRQAVSIAEDWEYDEINLNVGCPSDRVAGNEMGAILMAYPDRVAEMVSAMKQSTQKPITVKNRIGIDGQNVLPASFERNILDEYEDMVHFIKTVASAGADRFIVHARIAILAGLSPKENREIPKLRYEDVYRLKSEFPQLSIIINGGIKTIEDTKKHLQHVDGVMIGRAAYDHPYLLTEVDSLEDSLPYAPPSRREIISHFIGYVEKEQENATTNQLLRHTLGLLFDKKGSKVWKQLISPPFDKGLRAKDILLKALEVLPQDVLDERR